MSPSDPPLRWALLHSNGHAIHSQTMNQQFMQRIHGIASINGACRQYPSIKSKSFRSFEGKNLRAPPWPSTEEHGRVIEAFPTRAAPRTDQNTVHVIRRWGHGCWINYVHRRFPIEYRPSAFRTEIDFDCHDSILRNSSPIRIGCRMIRRCFPSGSQLDRKVPGG